MVKLLLEREDVDPDHLDKGDDGPLSYATINGHEGVVKLLLGREDVDPNLQNKYGQTPLASAAIKGHEGVVKLLLEREDVDPNRPDKGGYQCSQPSRPDARALASNSPVRLVRVGKDGRPRRPSFVKTAGLEVDGRALQSFLETGTSGRYLPS